ncbi:MAG: S9 family peptidase [Myxococcota bacterium]
MHPPRAEKRRHVIELHGERREDPFAWLKVDDWQEVMRNPQALDGDVRRHLESENAYAEAFFSREPDLRKPLFEEMRARIKEDDRSVPEPDGPFAYYSRFETGGQHPVFCRTSREGENEQVLLHGDREAKGHAFWQIAGLDPDPSHTRFGYAVDLKGSEIYSVRFRRIGSDQDEPDVLEGTNGNFVWAEDGESLFYTVLDDNHRPSKVLRHRMGTPSSVDVVVYEEPDPGFFVGVTKTESRRFIVLDAHDHVTSEVRIVDAAHPERPATLVRAREPGIEYDVGHRGDRLFIRTNRDGAEDFKLMTAELRHGEQGTEIAPWEDVVPHRPGCLIVGFLMFQRFLVRLERLDALPRIVVRSLDSGEEHSIAMDEEVYALDLHGSREFETSTLRFTYSSMATPRRVYDYDMDTRERALRKEQEVPSGHDPSQYVVRRLTAVAPDGEAIPISVLHRKDCTLDGSAPALLYGYGAYGHSLPASFSTTRLSLVDRGFVFALAHVRGGMERGYRWYREGKGASKHHTFTDFIAAAEFLVQNGWCAPGRLGAQGGSAGGMLMGAVANLRPDLFGAIVAEVPFVDVLNTMADDTLPLTPPEWPEWGNPRRSEADYRNILSYAPYENVTAQDYPAMLVTAGLTDPRVTYWEPAKWVARLRERNTSQQPIVFRTNMEAGHAGAAGRFDRLEETALVQAFLLKVLMPQGEGGNDGLEST